MIKIHFMVLFACQDRKNVFDLGRIFKNLRSNNFEVLWYTLIYNRPGRWTKR